MVARREGNQPNWLSPHELIDLRQLETELRHSCPGLNEAAESFEAAKRVVLETFGLQTEQCSKLLRTHAGEIQISGADLLHTVEKRQDARERYAKYAIKTLHDPFEIWKSLYDNGEYRLQFIGTFQTKNQMLVVASVKEINILWNFMHCDAKSLNKHRCGELIYQKHK